MLGRAAYHDPMLLARVDARIFGDARPAPALPGIVDAMAAYAERQLARGIRLNQISRHMLGLANGLPGARTFRQILSVDAARPGAGPETLLQALDAVEQPETVAA
jgi:tRNA-dihydrouridine synthase A